MKVIELYSPVFLVDICPEHCSRIVINPRFCSEQFPKIVDSLQFTVAFFRNSRQTVVFVPNTVHKESLTLGILPNVVVMVIFRWFVLLVRTNFCSRRREKSYLAFPLLKLWFLMTKTLLNISALFSFRNEYSRIFLVDWIQMPALFSYFAV